jgi:hypothetical protein
MAACDEISVLTADEASTAMSQYGETCGGRLEAEAAGGCTGAYPDAIPGETGDEFATRLDNARDLAAACEAADLPACDELERRFPDGSPYQDYAARCGGRTEPTGGCVTSLLPPAQPPPVEGDPVGDDCAAGIYSACDELAASSSDQELQTYGTTCGGRNEAVASCMATLLETLPEPGPAAELRASSLASLEVLAHACLGSDVGRCDELTAAAPEDSFPDHHQFGATCGGRLEDVVDSCETDDRVSQTPPADEPPTDVLGERLRRLADRCYEGNLESCARLVRAAGPGYEEFREYGESCGDRPEGERAGCTGGVTGDSGTPALTGSTIETTSPSVASDGDDVTTSPIDQGPLGIPTPVPSGGAVIVAPPPDYSPPPQQVPDRYREYDEVLRAIVASLQVRGMELTFSEGLQVDETTEVTVTIRGVVPVDVSKSLLERISSAKRIEVVIPIRLEGTEIGAGQEERRVRVELQVTGRPMLFGGEIGTFPLTPTTAEPSRLRALVSDPEMDRTRIELDYEIQLGLFEVEDRPWWERLMKLLIGLAAIVTALYVIAKPLGGLKRYREWRNHR